MPRFLNTSTGEFEWHGDPPLYVTYAILSHTWRSWEDGGEQSYEDVRKLQDEVDQDLQKLHVAVVDELKTLGLGPQPSVVKHSHKRPHPTATEEPMPGKPITILSHTKLSDKIREICRVARQAGYQLLWIDSSCIDKSSSAELSEAINSMYEWYRLANVCYVYLEDVPNGEDPTARKSKFWTSRWHKRGWTLQELLAPGDVVFLTKSWQFLGTKMGLASTLKKITHIPTDILTGEAPLNSVSVARRMSWAAERDTTRVEDGAYSLMGIFDVHMSPIYGEGWYAFLRLQEEIIKTIPDQSVFVWGDSCTLLSLDRGLRRSKEWDSFRDLSQSGLLASNPSAFLHTDDISLLSPGDLASRLGLQKEEIPPVHCVFTPQGVRLRLLFVDLTQAPKVFEAIFTSLGEQLCEDCLRLGRAHALAFLQCEDENGSLIAVPLRRPQAGVEDGDALLISTHVNCHPKPLSDHNDRYHFVRLGKEAVVEALPFLSPVSAEVTLLHHHRRPPVPKAYILPVPKLSSSYENDMWFAESSSGPLARLSPEHLEALRALGFTVTALQCERSQGEIVISTSLISQDDSASRKASTTQTIGVRIVLRTCRSYLGDTEVYLSVTNSFRSLSPATRQTSSPNGTADAPQVHNERHIRSLTCSSMSLWDPTLVDAKFVISASPPQGRKVFARRLLKLALMRPSSPAAAWDDALLLSIKLSDEYMPSRL